MEGKNTAAKIVSSILFIIAGIVIMANPASLNRVCYFFAIVALAAAVIAGLTVLIKNGDNRNRLRLTYALILLTIGVILILMPSFFDTFLPILLGIGCIVDGIVKLIGTSYYPAAIGKPASAIVSLCLIVLGIIVIVYRSQLMTSAKWAIGLALLITGIFNFISNITKKKG